MISGLMWYQRKTHHNVFSCCELFVVVSINDVNVNSGSASIFYKFNFIAAPAHNVSPDADRNKRTPILPASSRACHQLSSHHQYQTLWCLTPISIYFRQISLWISTQPLLSSPPLHRPTLPHSHCPLSPLPFSSLAAWHFAMLSGDSSTKWSYWESDTVNSRRPHVMCLKHRWTAQVSRSWRMQWGKKKKGERRTQWVWGEGGIWTDKRIILCFVWGRVSKQWLCCHSQPISLLSSRGGELQAYMSQVCMYYPVGSDCPMSGWK